MIFLSISTNEVLNYLPEDELIGGEDELKNFLQDYTDELYDLLDKDLFTDPLNNNVDIVQELQKLEIKERVTIINEFYKRCLKKQGVEEDQEIGSRNEINIDDIEKFSQVRKKLEDGVKSKEKKHLRFKTANLFMDRYNFAFIGEKDYLYMYDEDTGLYEKDGEQELREMIRKIWEGYATTHDVNEVVSIIKDSQQYSLDDFNTNENLIHLKNCIYDTENHETMDYDPDIKSTIGLNVEYNSDAVLFNEDGEPVSKIGEFLTEILKEDQMDIIQEIVGLCAIKNYPAQKAFFLYGDGANGKTTLMNLIQIMVGHENTSSRSLARLIYNKFASADLYGKLANLSGEVSSSKIASTDMFKRLTGDDPVSAEVKHKTFNGENSFQFYNKATLFFVQNEFPEIEDDTYAFYRRMVPLKFEYTIPENQRKDNYAKKIATDEEISAFFNWAMKGLKRYQERGHLSYSASVEEVRNEILGKMDSLKAFISSDRISFHEDAYVSKQLFKDEHSDYCNENEYKPKSKQQIGQSLPKKDARITASHTDIDGKDTNTWRGIYLKDTNHQGRPGEVMEKDGTIIFSQENRDNVIEMVEELREDRDVGVKKDRLIDNMEEELDLERGNSEILLDKMIENEKVFYDELDDKIRVF